MRLPYRLSRIGVGVEEDANTLKVVTVAKDRPHLGALLGQKDAESVTIESIALALNLELELDLERGCSNGLKCCKKWQEKVSHRPMSTSWSVEAVMDLIETAVDNKKNHTVLVRSNREQCDKKDT